MLLVESSTWMRTRGVAVALVLSLLFMGLIFKPWASDIPQLTGTLVFHRYSSYDAWDGELLTLDLRTKKLTNLTRGWKNVRHTINGHFSADGQSITFMGSQNGIEDWDIFVSDWSKESQRWLEPRNLTGPNGKRDEDPKFSPTASTIIYKENGVVATRDKFGGDLKYYPTSAVEASMPYFLPNGKDFLYESSGDIYLWSDSQGKSISQAMYRGEGIKSYYPIAIDNKSFLYTRVQSSRHDSIMQGFYSGEKSKKLFFNSDQWDTSDSYPYENSTRFIFYVSGDFIVPKGGYNLMLADTKKEKVYNLDNLFGEINTDLEELGPAWTQYSYTNSK